MPQSSLMTQPLKWPLATSIQSRDGTALKDARIINGYVELDPQSGKKRIRRRYGLISNRGPFIGLASGAYNWKGNVYEIWGQNLYQNGLPFGSTILDNSNGSYRFVQVKSTPGLLVFGNGIKAYFTDGATVTQITDANFPTSFVKGWAYLDGTLYVMTADGAILGSKNLDDPRVWDPLNRIVANIEPDNAVGLAKQLIYVIAFKQWTTEVFYDAQNPTGSPLGPAQGQLSVYGCVSADSIQDIDGTLLWLTSNRTVSPQVARMDALQVTIVSTPPVERLLESALNQALYSWVFKHAGHRFYGLTSIAGNRTLVYDLDQQMWYLWTDNFGNVWPVVSTSYDSAGNHLVQYQTSGLVSGPASGQTCFIDADYVYSGDMGVIIPLDIYTSNEDFGINRDKLLSRMYYNGDQVQQSILKVRCSDDDYQTWTNFRELDLSKPRPSLGDCGTFWRRAYHFRHESGVSFRMSETDMQFDIGVL